MTILDENTQVVPEGLYLELCNQLKSLHTEVKSCVAMKDLVVPEFPTNARDEADQMLNRRVHALQRRTDEIHSLTAELHRGVLNYNKKVIEYKEKHAKFTKVIDGIRKKEAQLKAREARLDDIEDNMSLAELQWRLISK